MIHPPVHIRPSPPCASPEARSLPADRDANAVRAARGAYRLSIGLRLGSQRIHLSLATPYHTPAHRRWTPSPAALSGAARLSLPAEARWRVAWARGSGEEIQAVVQGLLDQGDDALRQELGGVYLGALAEGHPISGAVEIASSWLQGWMMAEDLGVDEIGFARVAAGLGGHARDVADLLRGARPLRIDEVVAGDLVVDAAHVAVGVVEQGPSALLRAPCRRSRPGRSPEQAGEMLEIAVAHALPGDGCRLGPRRSRLWLARGDATPLGDDVYAGFSAFYRPCRPEVAPAVATSACCPR